MDVERNKNVPGQVVLPTLEEELGYEVIQLKPAHERFCWEYVMRGDNASAAYRAVKPSVKDSTARVEASKLLTNPAICERIKQIREEQRRRFQVTADDLLTYHGKVLKIDRREFIETLPGSTRPRPKALNEIDDEAASILEFETQKDSEGMIHVLFRVPTRHQSAVEMAKILGMNKERRELSGPDGGPIETESRVSIYIPDNGRDD